MELHLVTSAEHKREVDKLQKQIEELKAMITPFVEAERDSEQVLTWREATAYVRLTATGLSEARRQGRIKGIKINAKEFGYKKGELDKYRNRYQKH